MGKAQKRARHPALPAGFFPVPGSVQLQCRLWRSFVFVFGDRSTPQSPRPTPGISRTQACTHLLVEAVRGQVEVVQGDKVVLQQAHQQNQVHAICKLEKHSVTPWVTHGVGERYASAREQEDALKQNGASLVRAREPATWGHLGQALHWGLGMTACVFRGGAELHGQDCGSRTRPCSLEACPPPLTWGQRRLPLSEVVGRSRGR